MNQQERDEILLEIHRNYQVINDTQENIIKEQEQMKKGQQEMKKEQQEMKKEQQEMKKIQKEIWTSQKIMEERQKIFEETQKLMQQQQEELKTNQRTMEEELKKLGNTVTRMEYEHGRKLDMILEVLTGHTDKLAEHEKRFEKDEKIIEMHGHQIYGIEQKMQA